MTSSPYRPIPVPGDHIGDWLIIRELGRGGMATVHEVEHVETGKRRAIKIMMRTGHGDEDVRRFRREYRALSRLHHPNIAGVYEAGLYDDRPYFVMELLAGRELREEVESWRELPSGERFKRADAVMVQVARALEHLHMHGLVHRDVTPSNIIIDDNGLARLMDFGVVKEPGAELTTVGEVIGTVAYIAPEQIEGGRVDARADLYSLGAVYYLMLTGRRPFNARTVAGYIEKHLKRAVRPPHELAPNLPERSDQICLRLLAKDPADRFASATHLLLAIDDEIGSVVISDSRLVFPRPVGRTAELARLREALGRVFHADDDPADQAPDQRPGGLLELSGLAGMGRTRLAEEMIRLAAQMDIAVTIARNHAPDQRAYEGFRALYEDLIELSSQPPAPALVATFQAEDAADVTPERWAVLDAMKDLVRQSGPRVVFLVDPERGDRGSLEMLEYLVRNLVGFERIPIIFVLTRGIPEPDDPLHGLMTGAHTGVAGEVVRLGPLSASAVEEMLLDVVVYGPGVRELARRLQAEGEGTPFLVSDMLRGLIASGIIARGPDGRRGHLTVSEKDIAQLTLPVPRPVRETLRAWIEPLSPTARQVAVLLALARHELDLSMIIDASRLSEDEALAASVELIAAGLVRERRIGEEERFELARNRLRDVLVEDTSAEEKVRCNRRIGEALERAFRRRTAAVVELLAYHFEQGDRPAKAYPYLVDAADKLQRSAFVEEALDYLDRAIAIEPLAREHMTLDEADRRQAQLKLLRSQVLFHLGRWQEADAEVRAADVLGGDLGDARLLARTATELACQARRVLHLEQAEEQLRRALEYADQVGDRKLRIVPLYEYGAVLWSRGDLDSARDYFIQALAGSETYEDERSLALGYNGLGLISLCRGQSAEARRYFEQSIEVCERHGLMERLTIARTNLIEVYHLCGNLKKGLDLSDRSLHHSREVHHRYGIALALRYRVMMLTDLGRLVDAVDNAQEALRIQRALGNQEEALSSLVVLIRARMMQGEYELAERRLAQVAELIPDFDTEGFAPIVQAWEAQIHARAGREDQARAALDQAMNSPGRQWPFQQTRLKLNLARAYELLNEPVLALAQVEDALTIADASGYRYYAMRARQIAARLSTDPVAASRHQRVARALARSLAGSLPRPDAHAFFQAHGVDERSRVRKLAGEASDA